MVYASPVGVVESSDGVAQNMECADGRAGSVGHDFDMVGPVECLVEENAKVADEVGAANCKFTMGGNSEPYM